MENTLSGLKRTPDPLMTATQQTVTRRKVFIHLRQLRFYLYIVRGVLLLILTAVIFSNGVGIIRQNARALGFFALNFDVPLPFLLIGLWSLVVITLTIFSLVTIVKICQMVRPLLPRAILPGRRTAV